MAKFLAIKQVPSDGHSVGTMFVNLDAVRYAFYDTNRNSLLLRFDDNDSFTVPETATAQVLDLIQASVIPIDAA
jgi:hypothetical protein